jgi:hypothetical protein
LPSLQTVFGATFVARAQRAELTALCWPGFLRNIGADDAASGSRVRRAWRAATEALMMLGEMYPLGAHGLG